MTRLEKLSTYINYRIPGLISLLFCAACSNDNNSLENNFLVEKNSYCQLASTKDDDSNYKNASPLRTDIRDDAEGIFMHYKLRVVNVNDSCKPVAYAVVDLWQADSSGRYSVLSSHALRGIQNAGPYGEVQFMSVFPGWHIEKNQGSFEARSNHVNLKIHVKNKTVLNTEFYFPNDMTQLVHEAMQPYKRQQQKKFKKNNKIVTYDRLLQNEDDPSFNKIQGEALVMELKRTKQGYVGTLLIGVAL